MRGHDLRPTFCPICDQDFVDDISLVRLGLWFGLLNGSDEPEVDHNMLPQGESKMLLRRWSFTDLQHTSGPQVGKQVPQDHEEEGCSAKCR